jgi:Domain of unknown function (DUF4337)
MEEMEDTSEKLQEIREEIEENERKEAWMFKVALTTAIISVLAAITGLFAGHHANEAVIEQIKASDRWAQYQAKAIKLDVEHSTATILEATGKPVDPEMAKHTAKLEDDKVEIKKVADEEEHASQNHLSIHAILARAVTIFQVGIAISAIAIVTRKKWLWYGSMVLAGAGVYFMVSGFLAG